MQELMRIVILIAIVHVAVLAALLLIIRRLVLSDTLKAVAKINAVEGEVRKKEESIRQEIAHHEADFARKKSEAEEALQRQKELSEKELDQLRNKIVADAKKEGEKILDQARRNEENLRQQITLEMEEKAVQYGTQLFQMVFSEKITEELNDRFVSELLDALAEIEPGSITIEGDAAEFVSSHPLTVETKERLQRLLREKFGVDIQVQEKVQKDLLAGLVFKLGSLEIDGSLRNRYREAAAEVKKTAGA